MPCSAIIPFWQIGYAIKCWFSTLTPVHQVFIVIHAEALRCDVHGFQNGLACKARWACFTWDLLELEIYLLTTYKSFIRPFLDYADMIYDQRFNEWFSKKIESVQYNVALATRKAIKGSSHKKLYLELGLDYLYWKRWARRLCLLYEIFSTGQQSYI